jgi:hypothetical protein
MRKLRHIRSHETTNLPEETNPALPGLQLGIRFLRRVSFPLRFLFSDATVCRTWNAHFRESDGKFNRTPSLAAIYDDAPVDDPGK